MKIDTFEDFSYQHSINKKMRPPQDIFDFYNKDKSKRIGQLVCHKSKNPLRPNYSGSVLAIDFLVVRTKNKGVGTEILKFAEEYSKQIGCNGYLTLKADGSYMPERVPHVFYRKFGFSTFNKKNDIRLDKFIKKDKIATIKDFPSLLMHYPPEPRKISILISKCVKLLKRFGMPL